MLLIHRHYSAHWLFFLMAALLFVFVTQPVLAGAVFENKKKASHALSGSDLKRLQAEYRAKFGGAASRSPMSSDPWQKKKKKTRKAGWAECRDYALQMRNRCYRKGLQAYRCEQIYDARVELCNNGL